MLHYGGGIVEWQEKGEAIASLSQIPQEEFAIERQLYVPPSSTYKDRLLLHISRMSFASLLGLWFVLSVIFGFIFWLSSIFGPTLNTATGTVQANLHGLTTSMYFSFITALTIGYGDIAPLGPMRILAIGEGAMGLLIFGIVISKLVSRRQDELLAEIHRIAFEDRLGRVRSNLHTVLAEMETIERLCNESGLPSNRLEARLRSSLTLFIGELEAIHDVLYHPQQAPNANTLKAIIATLVATLEILDDIVSCHFSKNYQSRASSLHFAELQTRLTQFCKDCIPPVHAEVLSERLEYIEAFSVRFAKRIR